MPLIAFRCSKNCYVHLVTCTAKETHTSFNTKMHDPTLNICCWRQFQNMTEVLTHHPDSLKVGPPDYHPFRTLKDYTNSWILTGILWKSGRTFPVTANSNWRISFTFAHVHSLQCDENVVVTFGMVLQFLMLSPISSFFQTNFRNCNYFHTANIKHYQ